MEEGFHEEHLELTAAEVAMAGPTGVTGDEHERLAMRLAMRGMGSA